MAINKFDTRQSINRTALPMVGSAASEELDDILGKIDPELAKLFEDRNIRLADGGVIAVPSAGTSVTFTQALKLHINSQVAGGTPTVIDLAATTRTLSANLRMLYAVINRTAGTATVTDDASSLPAQTSANQEVVLIAKRIDSADGTKTVYFRDGTAIVAGQSARLGMPSVLDSSFTVGDATDPTKQIGFDAAGTTGTKTTIASSQTANRTQTLQDATDTFVYRATVDQLTNKQVGLSVVTDSSTTGSNQTIGSFSTGVVRLTNASLQSVSGLPGGSSGLSFILENKTGNAIVINNEEATATAANRIQTGTGGNISMANNASCLFLYDSTTSRWQLVGGTGSGSGSGSKNYLSAITTSQSSTPNTGNGNFELGSTTGWSLGTTGTLTNGLPTGTPTFGSGASGNLSISTVSSGQLAGSYSLSYASSAATTQGNMLASDAFYIDKEDQAKVLGWKFHYLAQTNPSNANWSGTSSNSFGVAFYDVTNSAWLPNTGNFSMTQNSGVGVASGSFQTASNTTQIRMVVYNVNATSGAATVYFDDFFCGPQIIPQGFAGTDKIAFTPTGSWTSNCTYTGFWRKNGDVMEVEVNIALSGAPTSTGLTINLPSGYSIDTAKLAQTNAGVGTVGDWTGWDNGNSLYYGKVGYNTTTSVVAYVGVASGSYLQNTNVTQAVPFSFGNTDAVYVTFQVPIAGWSSNVQMSNDTDTRVVAFAAQTSSTAITSSGYTSLSFSTTTTDTHGGFNGTTTYTVPVSGYYDLSFSGATAIPSGTFSATFTGRILKNGSTEVAGQADAINSNLGTGNLSAFCATIKGCRLNAGDTLVAQAATNNSIANTTIDRATFSVTRVSGPAVIAASESVNAVYGTTAGNTIGNSNTIIDFATKEIDSHNAVTTGASWKFTAPVSGVYEIAGFIYFQNASYTAGQSIGFYIFKNGTQHALIGYALPQASVTLAFGASGNSKQIRLNAGDYIDLRANNQRGNTNLDTGAGFNWVSIKRVGN